MIPPYGSPTFPRVPRHLLCLKIGWWPEDKVVPTAWQLRTFFLKWYSRFLEAGILVDFYTGVGAMAHSRSSLGPLNPGFQLITSYS